MMFLSSLHFWFLSFTVWHHQLWTLGKQVLWKIDSVLEKKNTCKMLSLIIINALSFILSFFFNCRLSGKTWKMAAKFLSILKFCPRKKINTLLKGLKVKWYMYYKLQICVLRSLIVISKKIKFIYCLQEIFCKYITNDDFGKFPSQITHI